MVAEELKGVLDNPKQYIGELVRKNLFAGPLARNVNDSLAALPAISLADVVATYRRFYVGRNIIVSLNGNLEGWDARSLRALLYQFLGRLPRGRANKKLFGPGAVLISRPMPMRSKSSNSLQQRVIQVSYPLPPQRGRRHTQQHYYLKLFQLVFVGLTSGRLFQRLREQHGLVYSVQAVQVSHDQVGYFAIKTTTTLSQVAQVLAILRKEIVRVQQRGLSQAEFALAKNNFLATWAMTQEDVMTPAAYHATELFYAGGGATAPLAYTDVPKLMIDKLTLKGINAMIAHLFHKPGIITLL